MRTVVRRLFFRIFKLKKSKLKKNIDVPETNVRLFRNNNMFDLHRPMLSILWILICWNINGLLGQPTYYTPFIEECNYEGARNMSRRDTETIFKDNEVHGGYFTVNKKLDINLYSLFVKSSKDWKNAPLIVWLQGQPACTSLYALFGQNGPYWLTNGSALSKNVHTWTDEYNVLYLDSMIFTGYSYAQNISVIHAYLDDIGVHLYDALYQFHHVFPTATHNDLFLAGEMYSGKYSLLLGHVIHKKNPISHIKMRLKGLYIGGGFTDPENMLEYSAIMYQIGLIDYTKMKDIQNMEESIRKGIRSQKYDNAQQQLLSVWIEMELVGFKYPMDFTQPNKFFDPTLFNYLQSPTFRDAFHLQNAEFYPKNVDVELAGSGGEVKNVVDEDVLKTVKHLLPVLLKHYRVLYFGGQFDLMVPYVHIANFLRLLEWEGAEMYFNKDITRRRNWYVDDDLAGYYKTVMNLTEVLVRNASHMVDASQPKWARMLLKNFIENKFLNQL